MKRNVIGWGAAAVLAAAVASPASARPPYLQAFKDQYKVTATSKPRINAAANCAVCHIGAPRDAKWNGYGEALGKALGAKGVTDKAKLAAALAAVGKMRPAGRQQTYDQIIERDNLPGAPGGGARNMNNQPPAQPAQAAAAPLRGTWEALFNGVNMDGWAKMNQGNWTIQNGVLKYTGGGNGWLRTTRQFKNYSMVVVWKYTNATAANDAGIFLKGGMAGNPWPTGGVQLNMGPRDNFGSIGGISASRPRADLIKRNDWNTYQVTVMNGDVTVAINNQVAWPGGTLASLNQNGYIGLQVEGFPVEFAQIWVMPLP